MTTLLRAGRLETDGETAACAGIRKPCIAPSAATPPRNARRRMLISLAMLSPLNQLSTVANFHRSSFVIVRVTTASATYSMAALAYLADSSRTPSEVRQVPQAAVSNRGRTRASLDHLVGAGEQRRRHREAEGLGGFEVDHKLELS